MNQTSSTTRLRPATLGQAFAVELALIYARPYTPEQRTKQRQTAWRALQAILDGVRWQRDGATFWFESQSALEKIAKGEDVHPDLLWHQCPAPAGSASPDCTCEAASRGLLCWHPSACAMIARILDVDLDLPFDARTPRPSRPRPLAQQVASQAAELFNEVRP